MSEPLEEEWITRRAEEIRKDGVPTSVEWYACACMGSPFGVPGGRCYCALALEAYSRLGVQSASCVLMPKPEHRS